MLRSPWVKLYVLFALLWSAWWLWLVTHESINNPESIAYAAAFLAFPHVLALDIYLVIRASRTGWGRVGVIVWAVYVVAVLLLTERPWGFDTIYFLPVTLKSLFIPPVVVLAVYWVMRAFHADKKVGP